MNAKDPMATSPPTLANCEDEPIHIPGLIQPHGLLLAFDLEGRLQAWSANAEAMLGAVLRSGMPFTDVPFGTEDELLHEVEACLEGARSNAELSPIAMETTLGGRNADFLVHAHEGRVLVEIETRTYSNDELAAFALRAHRSLNDLKRARSVESLLQSAANQVRAMNGFDRVMAYRFRHDDSGDVVAEARLDSLEPYAGRRYPASDIPAQARRLYTLNTLRFIADVNAIPVPMVGVVGQPPVDMSHAVLRSVSPIHIEYLQNMGVAASMSVSIVIEGKLWGMLACHHGTARHVPHSLRMACDVIAQVIAASLQSMLARDNAAHISRAAELRTRLTQSLLDADDVLSSLRAHEERLRDVLDADALILSEQGKITSSGGIDATLASAIVSALSETGATDVVQRTMRREWPEALQRSIGKWVGLLALPFDPESRGWIVALRAEQIETVRWGGRPEKEIGHGPLGPRLTPRGSFDEWRETVRDTAPPWSAGTLQLGRELLAEALHASTTRYAAIDRTRTELLAMLGHDLRNPLQTISLAATMLQGGGNEMKLGRRLQTASGRMQRLITDVMDMSRLRTGLGLGMATAPVDLTQLIVELVDEMRIGHPGVDYEIAAAPGVIAQGDRDRLAQVISNLVSNARHHGEPGQSIGIDVVDEPETSVIRVRNAGAPIPDGVAATMYNPFKKSSLHHATNRTGLGIGLYIAQQIVQGHGGTLLYTFENPNVVFTARLPKA